MPQNIGFESGEYMSDAESYQFYSQKLKQAAWRIQYYARKRRSQEWLILEDVSVPYKTETEAVSNVFLQEMLNKIPSEKGKYIIHKLILEGYSEKEIASDLHISQQAVSKWKKKSLDILRLNLHP